MAEFKLNLNDPKTGKAIKREVSAEQAEPLLGKNIGDKIAGDKIGLNGYELEITGGSDNAGFPMRYGIAGFGRKRILTYKGTGFSGKDRWKKTQSGLRVKTTISGQQVYPRISQINMKITKMGSENIFEAKAEGDAAAEAPAAEEKKEAPTEKPAAEPKAEEKAPEPAKEEASKAEEKPAAEEKKEAPKEEPKAEEKPAEEPAPAKE